jgi:hypothetical protein
MQPAIPSGQSQEHPALWVQEGFSHRHLAAHRQQSQKQASIPPSDRLHKVYMILSHDDSWSESRSMMINQVTVDTEADRM